MAKKESVVQQRESEEELPGMVPEGTAQVAVRQGADIDPRTGARVHIGVPERSDEEEVSDFIVWLQEKADAESQDTVARIAESLRKASSAQSIADLLRETETVSGKDYVGIPFVAKGFRIHEGEFEDEELKYFASIDAVDPKTGKEFIANCGGERVLVFMRWLEVNAEWPLYMCFTGKQTRKGRTILGFDILENV